MLLCILGMDYNKSWPLRLGCFSSELPHVRKTAFLRLQKYKWKQNSSTKYDERTFYLLFKIMCYSYKSFFSGKYAGFFVFCLFFPGYTRGHKMHLSLDCMLIEWFCQGVFPLGKAKDVQMSWERVSLFFSPPQCSGLILKLRVLNIFMSIGSYSFQVVEVCISQVIKYVLELSSSAEHVMCNSVFWWMEAFWKKIQNHEVQRLWNTSFYH